MKRRNFLKHMALGSTLFPISHLKISCSKKYKSPPNILWIISEDTSPDFACYSNSLVETPNVDILASQGVRFNNAFATAPVCSAARSAFNTGMYQTSFGAHHHRTKNKKPLPKPIKVISDYFRQAGYFTSNCAGLNFDKPGKTDWNFTLDHGGFDGTDWRQRKPNQPFFAQVNLQLTHRKFVRDKERPISPDDIKLLPIYPDHPILRRDWADYLESIQVLDRQIGQVLQRLEDDGLADNTIVFYFGDHGSPHLWAKQWLYEGGIRVPFIVRRPNNFKENSVNDNLISLIDLVPTCLSLAGLQVPDFLHGENIFSNKISKREYIFAARDRCDETVDRIRCVRSKQYKYIRNFMPERTYTQFNTYKTNQYPAVPIFQSLHKQGKLTLEQAKFMAVHKPDEEFYDLKNDPYETKNLVSDPTFQNVLSEMRQQLDKWIEKTNDQGAIPEETEEINFWKNRQSERHVNFTKKKGLTEYSDPEDHVKYWENRFKNR